MEIQIRPAAPEDRTYVERCMVFCDGTFADGLSPERPLKEVLDLIQSEKSVIFVAEKNGGLIGFAGAYQFSAHDATGLGSYVEVPMRRFGIASALRAKVEAELKTRGVERMFGLIAQYNEKGMNNALTNGYRPVAVMVRKDLK